MSVVVAHDSSRTARKVLVAKQRGLLIAFVAVKEGSEAWRGEGCCVSA